MRRTMGLFIALILAFLGFLKLLNYLASKREGIVFSLIHWIHAITFEIFGICLSGICRASAYFGKQKVEGSGQPILMVHGYLHNGSAWIYQKRQLAKLGKGPIYTFNLKRPFASIEDHARQVAQKAIEIEKETGRSDLILIGHSMGGLVSSLYATQLAPPGKITHVITIGSPLSGTHIAKIAIGADGREMERGSPKLVALSEAISNSQGTVFYHIGSKTDQIIIPHTSAILGSNSDRHMVIKDLGHISLLYSPRIARKISEWITESTQNPLQS